VTLRRLNYMSLTRIATAALLMLLLTAAVQGQTPDTLDVSRLPVNLERIQRGLRQSTTREESQGLNIRYVVDVFGQAPPLVFLRPEDNLVYGPVPYGAPTHREMIEHVTPKEYRAPAADFSALLRWLAERAKK
jgi:hypothetical protein